MVPVEVISAPLVWIDHDPAERPATAANPRRDQRIGEHDALDEFVRMEFLTWRRPSCN